MTIEWGKLFKEMLACERAFWSEKRGEENEGKNE